MGVRDILYIFPDGGDISKDGADTHIECRSCGANLAGDVSECPDCGGDVAVYEL